MSLWNLNFNKKENYMKVKELIDALTKCPPDADIAVCHGDGDVTELSEYVTNPLLDGEDGDPVLLSLTDCIE
jgi:hypothetical protein